jgi:flagellar biosynthesis protein FliR
VGALYAQSANVLYISMAVNAVSAVLLFMAFQKLKVHQKSGWNLVYYNMLLGITASLVSSVVFATYALVGGLIGVAIGLAIGGTLLFQIRKYFQ